MKQTAKIKHARNRKGPASAKCGAKIAHRYDTSFNWAFVNCSECRALKRPDGPPAFRFFRKVNKHTLTGCWLWTGTTNTLGYGHFKADTDTTVRAHRWSYEYHIGPIPEGMLVMHKCDTPGCVNPDHLEVGTPKENSEDCVRKGRRKGTHKRLTTLQREQIRLLKAEGVQIADIARILGTTRSTVWRWTRGKRRKAGDKRSLAADEKAA